MNHLTLVDCQSHLVPPFLLELIEEFGAPRLKGARVPQDTPPPPTPQTDPGILVTFEERFSLLLKTDGFTPEAALKRMDETGITASVVSINMPGAELFSADSAALVAARCNDWLAGVCRESGGRLVGIAQLPWHDSQASLQEIHRAIGELEMRGILLPSNIAGTPVDAPQFHEIYRTIAALGVPVVIHPAHPDWSEAVLDYSMVPMLGFMTDSSIAALRLVLSGLTERIPTLPVVHPHCRRELPWLMPRVEEQTERKGRGREHISRPPGSLYSEFYLDLQAPSAAQIAWTAAHSRSDRLLFATDAPWVDPQMMIDFFMNAEMDAETRRRAAWKNAAELFRIEGLG
jgi:predicted TIM-barrel fold metal-dependent hydrolase